MGADRRQYCAVFFLCHAYARRGLTRVFPAISESLQTFAISFMLLWYQEKSGGNSGLFLFAPLLSASPSDRAVMFSQHGRQREQGGRDETKDDVCVRQEEVPGLPDSLQAYERY